MSHCGDPLCDFEDCGADAEGRTIDTGVQWRERAENAERLLASSKSDVEALRRTLRRVRTHLDEFLAYCEGEHLPSEIEAKRLWVDVNEACADALSNPCRL